MVASLFRFLASLESYPQKTPQYRFQDGFGAPPPPPTNCLSNRPRFYLFGLTGELAGIFVWYAS